MILSEYKKRVLDTKVYPIETDNFGRAYVTFGIIGEAFEFANSIASWLEGGIDSSEEKDVIKELGDVWWYATTGSYEYGIDINYVHEPFQGNFEEEMGNFLNSVVNLAEPCKKYYRDGTNKVQPFGLFLDNLGVITNGIASMLSITPEQIWQANYEKLKKRRETGTLMGEGSNREEQF